MYNRELRYKCFTTVDKFIELINRYGILDFFCGENRVLPYLFKNQDLVIHPSDLSEELGFTRQRVTSILNSLKKKEYIEATSDIGDGRKYVIKITEKGKNEFSVLHQRVISDYEKLVDECGEETVEAFTDNMKKIIDTAVKGFDLK